MRTRFTIILNPHDQQKISVSLPPFSVRDCRRLVLELAQNWHTERLRLESARALQAAFADINIRN